MRNLESNRDTGGIGGRHCGTGGSHRHLLSLALTACLAIAALACGKSVTGDAPDPDDSGIRFDATLPDSGPAPGCGDGTRGGDEECDDGNAVAGDGCSPTCTVERSCGDSDLSPGEQCDDGNNIDGDGCSADCRREAFCGDAVVDEGEVCDDGGNFSGDGCRSDCRSDESCGNGIVDSAAGELCDDGNDVDGDGCAADCRVREMCGDDRMSELEQCDDGNLDRFDGCGPDCNIERSLVISNLQIGSPSVGCDYSGDGAPDNGFSRALGAAAGLLNGMFLANAPANGDLLIALHMLGLDDPAAVDDPSFTVAWMQATDPDDDNANNLTGSGTLTVDPNAFDDMGRPLTSFASQVADRQLSGGPEDILLPLGFLPLELNQGQLRGTTVADDQGLSALTDGLLCGAVPVSTIAALPNFLEMFAGPAAPCDESSMGTSLADVLVGGTPRGFLLPLRGAQPDVDLDGDGLERFEVDRDGPDGCQPVVVACVDGDGTIVEGRNCIFDPQFADGWSAGFEIEAVRVTLQR